MKFISGHMAHSNLTWRPSPLSLCVCVLKILSILKKKKKIITLILHYLTLQKILPKHTCIETIIQRTTKPRFSPTQNIKSRWTWQRQFIGNLRWLLYSNANCLTSSSLPLPQGVHSTVTTPHPNRYSVSNHSVTRVMKSSPQKHTYYANSFNNIFLPWCMDIQTRDRN